MKISLNHLNKLFSFSDIPLNTLVEELSLSSCEIESVEFIEDNENNNDTILDVISTANRGDLLSYIGIAREISALIKKEKIKIDLEIDNTVISSQENIFDSGDCLATITGSITNIQNNKSPLWLQHVLLTSGIKISGDINDTVNYIMLETGFPLIILSDNLNSDNLDPSILINSNETISNQFNNKLILKGVLYSSQAIRKLSKELNIKNNITQRYERGLTNQDLEYSYRRAIFLLDTIHGAVVDNLNYLYLRQISEATKPIIVKPITIINRLGKTCRENITINASDIAKKLNDLGFYVLKSGEIFQVSVPYYRQNDVQREIDIVEEIGRIYGFNNFIDTIPRVRSYGKLTSQEILLRKMRSRLKILGFNEFINYSLGSYYNHLTEKTIQLKNPLTSEFSNLRQTLLYNILNNISYNLKTRNGLTSGYEIGRLFDYNSGHGYKEHNYMSLVIAGEFFDNNWYNQNQDIDWFTSKGIVEELLSDFSEKLNWQKIKNGTIKIYKNIFHPYNISNLFINGDFLGIFGQLHPKVLKSKDINYKVYALEINIDVLVSQYKTNINTNILYKQYSLYPYITRDITLNVPKKIMAEIIKKDIMETYNSILTKVEVLSLYEGDQIQTNYKNISFRLYYQAYNRTLTVSEVDDLHSLICNKLNFKIA
uniref:phenylalanine--tRNA ligase n=1 Tax=Porphyridium purpureum TaxID=35688 RepID=A0A343KNX7_PORPP|nr:phenylalanyl tRNA synthetase beta subunit [Porphyridium purpureum]